MADIQTISISEHAYLRLKERNGWNGNTARRMVPRIYREGRRDVCSKGYLKQWVKSKEDIYYDNVSEYVVYGDVLYIFREKKSHYYISSSGIRYCKKNMLLIRTPFVNSDGVF